MYPVLTKAFRHRPGRVIALGRLILAATFLLAIWLDPSQPAYRPEIGYALLLGYGIWSAALLSLTWADWWRDHRLARVSHAIDIAVFGGLVFFTEGYTSPFYTFFVFLLLSSAIRWSWRETAQTAVSVLAIFLVAGLGALLFGTGEMDVQRLLVRCSHLVVMSLLLIWFGINQQLPPEAVRPDSSMDETVPNSLPVEQALRGAAARLNASRVVFLWQQPDEPWLLISELDHGEYRSSREAPEERRPGFSAETSDRPLLFDVARGKALRQSAQVASRWYEADLDGHPLASRFELGSGIAIPIQARECEGELIATGISGLCAADLSTADVVAREISRLFDRSSNIALSEEAAVDRAKRSLSRDLHDSVVQVLAGAVLRLEALKAWLSAGRDPNPEIDTMKDELTVEQLKVRDFLARLRRGRGAASTIDLAAGLETLSEELRRRWNLQVDVREGGPIAGPYWMEHELHQIIREAAANAVRHGKASRLSVDVAEREGVLQLLIENDHLRPGGADNGSATAGGTRPWSVHERTSALGGTLSFAVDPGISRLSIEIPIERRP